MKKKILFVSNYYAPYTSGITEGERLLAEELAKRGYMVKVITSKHDCTLSKKEMMNGVEVERCSVQMKISKGTVSIPFIVRVIREARRFDLVNMQLPMLEAGLVSIFIDRKKLVPMYHCDINLPNGIWNRLIILVMDLSHHICLKRSSRIWVTSIDYAKHSRVAYRYKNKFVETGGAIKKIDPGTYIRAGKYKIGFFGRIVEEKGIDILIQAFEVLKKQGVNAQLLIGGDFQDIAGGSIYPDLKNYIQKNQIEDVWFLGKIPEKKIGIFYSSLDVLVLPSIHSLEAFGLVQVEAMLCGTPVVASDLYGVRTVVKKTGMGRICQAGNPFDFADGIKKVLEHREDYVKDRSFIQSIFSTGAFVDRSSHDINF